MLRLTRTLLAAAALLAAVPPSAFAQDTGSSISFGYSYMKLNGDHHSGAAVDFNRDFRTHNTVVIRGVGNFAFLHHSSRDVFTAAGGVQLAWTNFGRFVPFAEGTAGVFQINDNSNSTNFVVNYGGGADIKLNDDDRWRIRTYVGWASVIGDHSETGFRFVGGVQFRY